MKDCRMGNIVLFEDGTYFNGVKSKIVKRTKNFKDAKVFSSMTDRDARYLEGYRVSWKIVEAVFTIEFKEEV